ncbi:AAA family ATPase [Caldibacillus lycopersici]|uniref:AAA family ATPase n=1 Tax=Perspicuibacillus lycopersici TaxID=1325689 RepID=A0AAE3IWI3_9BACI|nr:AAA family ATPase [Perspicuibacillus lycopersici]MCU9614689.1 AAA family ATPase [Perspicuibacillus lycopersici]
MMESTKNNTYHNRNSEIDSMSLEDLLAYLVSNYVELQEKNPSKLATLLSTFANKLSEIGMRNEFVKIWMEKVLELDATNRESILYLTEYNWQEKANILDSLTFSAIRESDNRSARKTTIGQYKQICQQFLPTADDTLEELRRENQLLQTVSETKLIQAYKQIIELLENVIEEITQFVRLLDDYEESASMTFYNTSYFEMIQKTVSTLNEYKKQWKTYFAISTDVQLVQEESALQQLENMIGLTEVKSRIQDFYAYLKYQKQRKQVGFQTKDELSLNMVLLGNPGTGKTTLARLLAKIYFELGVLPSEEVIETNRSQLVGSFQGQTEENVRMIVEKALGGVLFIDEAYSLKREGQSGNDYGQTAIDTLVSLMSSSEYGGKFSVILAGYPEEMRQFLDSNPGLRSRFPASNIIDLPNYTLDELIKIGDMIAKSNDFLVTNNGKKELAYLIEQERVDSTFGNARTVHNLIMQAIFQKGTKNDKQPDIFSYTVLDKGDFQKTNSEHLISQTPMEQLNQLIGLSEIKEAVQTYISFVKMQAYRHEHNFPHVPIQLHSVFTGNPGTGKTTVAKIYAELLKECGMLKRGHLVVAGRADLIAGYVGQSAIKTKKKIREALGGVLFIDEAYALFRENSSDYGKEVVDTLVEEMTKHGENLVVVLAGYPMEMERLLESNPGLKSRFKKFFHFPDYSVEELIAIMIHYANKYAYEIDDKAIQFIQNVLEKHPVKGNGRYAENMIHEALQQQALRLMSSDNPYDQHSVNVIQIDDIKMAYDILKKGE